MRIADRLALHGAQPEPLRGVVGRLLQPAVVEHQRLGLAVFEEQLAVVGAFEAAAQKFGDACTVERGAVEQRCGGTVMALFRQEESSSPEDRRSSGRSREGRECPIRNRIADL